MVAYAGRISGPAEPMCESPEGRPKARRSGLSGQMLSGLRVDRMAHRSDASAIRLQR